MRSPDGALAKSGASRSRSLKAPNLLEAGCLLLVIAFAVTTPSGGWQFAFPLAAMILIYVFSFDQVATRLLRSPTLQKLGLWSYSIYMIPPSSSTS